jgi:hypothetical protein
VPSFVLEMKNQVSTSQTQPTTDQYQAISNSSRNSSIVSSIDNYQATLSHTTYCRQRNPVSVDIIRPKLLVYNDIVLALDAGFNTALLLLDFDCVDHAILIQILQHQFGITSTVLLWIISFISNRSHKVRIGSKTSRTYNILFGVPQGSILGPLLFILYTSSITNIAHRHGNTIHLYAEDTQLYIKLYSSSTIDLQWSTTYPQSQEPTSSISAEFARCQRDNEYCLKILFQALIMSQKDYCNSVLASLPKTTLQPQTSRGVYPYTSLY